MHSPDCFRSDNVSTAISESEEGSDVELKQAPAAKKSGRGRKSASYQNETPEEDDVVSPNVKNENAAEDDEGPSDADEDMDEEVYGCESQNPPASEIP
jgi:hypothetical protein